MCCRISNTYFVILLLNAWTTASTGLFPDVGAVAATVVLLVFEICVTKGIRELLSLFTGTIGLFGGIGGGFPAFFNGGCGALAVLLLVKLLIWFEERKL